jgi:beta-phosphoglucomutase-like phosphatase (HAD superfamily)
MKPSPIPFMSISQRAGVVPERVLFIGDSYLNDVAGAANVGMYAALLRRPVEGDGASTASSASVAGPGSSDLSRLRASEASDVAEKICDVELNGLQPPEFGAKIIEFLCKSASKNI